MQIDNYLIAQAQIKASGAAIHKLTSKIMAYKNSIETANEMDECDSKITLTNLAEQVEKKLRIFVSTGVLN